MWILRMIGKILLVPVWIIIAAICGIVSLVVNVLGVARVISGIVLLLLLVGTIVCYQDITQALFLIILIMAGYLLLFAGVAIEVVLESVRNKIGKMILA